MYDTEIYSPTRTNRQSRYPIDVTQLFTKLWWDRPTKLAKTAYENIQHCPSCCHNDWSIGMKLVENGGILIRCFHGSCEFNKTTGWFPGSYPSARLKNLYELLGGDKDDLIHDPYKKWEKDAEEMREFFAGLRTWSELSHE